MFKITDELRQKAADIKTFREWLRFALVECDPYYFDDPDRDEQKTLESWSTVIGTTSKTIKMYLSGAEPAPGQFIWSVWTVWRPDGDCFGENQSINKLVHEVFDRIKYIPTMDVSRSYDGRALPFGFDNNTPARMIIEYRIFAMGRAIAAVGSFEDAMKIIREAHSKANELMLRKDRRS